MLINGRTRVAVLGTLAEFHNGAIPFDLAGFLAMVAAINPDLLCLDITPRQWCERDFDGLPLEYRDALLPLARQTDIVVVPIGTVVPPSNEAVGKRRRQLIDWLRRWIVAIQRTVPAPDAASQGWRHTATNYLYAAIRLLSAGNIKGELTDYVNALVRKVIEVSQQDPGSRVLVVVNVQHCHIVRRRLRDFPDVEVANFRNL